MSDVTVSGRTVTLRLHALLPTMRKMFILTAFVTAGLSLSGSVPEPAAACSCVELHEQVDLELVAIEAADGGHLDDEAAFWPSEARLVRTSTEEAFDSEILTISLERRSVP